MRGVAPLAATPTYATIGDLCLSCPVFLFKAYIRPLSFEPRHGTVCCCADQRGTPSFPEMRTGMAGCSSFMALNANVR